MKISIVICTFNKSFLIQETLLSVLNQTYQNIEIIIVDDCSSDDTCSIIRDLIKNDNRVSIIVKKKNESVHCSRIDGMKATTGDYVLILDGDDILMPNACNEIAACANTGKDIYEFGHISFPHEKKLYPKVYNGDRVANLLDGKNQTIWNKAYKKQLINRASSMMEGFYSNSSEDLYEMLVFLYNAQSYGYINKPLIKYRTDSGTTAKKKDFNSCIKYFEETALSFEKISNFINKYIPIYNDKLVNLEKWLLNYCVNHIIFTLAEKNSIDELFRILPKYFSTNAINMLMQELFFEREKDNDVFFNRKSIFYFTKKVLKMILPGGVIFILKKIKLVFGKKI